MLGHLQKAHFKSIRHLTYDIFPNEFPAYFGKCHKLSYDIQKYVLIKKCTFDLSWTKGLKKSKMQM